ncbi:MAG: type II toxin-antitoxin system VapC family toxin [Acidimicrobiales bacterium]
MIAYVDSSTLARAYLVDEPGHEHAAALLTNADVALVTGTWTRIEVSGALVRAARAGRRPVDPGPLLALLDADVGPDGPVTVLAADQQAVETAALGLVRAHGIRARDVWHLAVARLTLPALAEPGEALAFLTGDGAQRDVAHSLGLVTELSSR